MKNSNPPILHRNAQVRKVSDDRTVELSFSSEQPVERWFGLEVLGHRSGEVDTSRLDDGAAVLVNHDTGEIPVAVVERASIKNGRGDARIRFGESTRANEVFKDVQDGILRHVSVGYFVRDMELAETRDDGKDVYRVTRWEPFELSLVSVPADTSVGVGREDEQKSFMRYFEMQQHQTRSQQKRANNGGAPITSGADNPAVRAERERVEELTAIGEAYNCPELAMDFVRSGASVTELNSAILERSGMEPTKAEDPIIGMSRSDVQQFSFIRLINALASPQDSGAQRAAAFELDCSSAAAAQLKKEARGAIIPYDVLTAQRDMSVGVAGDGGNLVATDLDSNSFIDLLRNSLALVEAGATHLPGLNGNLAIPRQSGGVNHYWVAENGTVSETSATFDQITLSPKTVGAYTELSRRLLKQSSVPAETFAIMELVRALEIAIDYAGINGDGTGNAPTGILNTAGIGDVALGANGLAPDWDSIVDLESSITVANADMGRLAYLTNSKVRGKLKKTRIETGYPEMVWNRNAPDRPLNGSTTVCSNNVPSDLDKGTSVGVCSAIIYGNFADLILGMWGGLDIQVNPYSLDTKGAVRVTAFQDLDFAVRHPESFCAIQDALTS